MGIEDEAGTQNTAPCGGLSSGGFPCLADFGAKALAGRTQFGYHLIKIESKENWTFEEAKPEMERRLKPEAAMKVMQELEKKGSAVLDPEFFNLPKQ